MRLTSREKALLQSVCDALVPSIASSEKGEVGEFWRRSAAHLPLQEFIAGFLGAQRPRVRRDFRRLLALLASPLLGLTWGGPFKPFDRLDARQREALLQSWSVSRFHTLRQAFNALKKLGLFAFYGYCPPDGLNPSWKALGYPGPQTNSGEAEPHGISSLEVESDLDLRCQALVVGSGAGGGVVAGELAQAGLDVIVAEKGGNYDESQFCNLESKMAERLYEGSGLATSHDGSVNLLAGSCLGGGTTVNWAGSFRTPDYVLREWARLYQLPQMLEQAYQQSMEAVCQTLGVTLQGPRHNPQNQALWDASLKRGDEVEVIARNIRGCPQPDGLACGYCGMGCRLGSKQSVLRTYLRSASRDGARVLCDTAIERLMIEQGRVVGALGHCRASDGRRYRVRIRADQVAVAAGSIHSPALLRRSGLENRWIGRNLFLHPTVGVTGFYGRPIHSWWGPMMSVVNNAFIHLDGDYGFKLETPPVHVAYCAPTVPWHSAQAHKEIMLDCARAAHFIVLTRDRYGGRVTLDRQGYPVVRYKLHRYDRAHMLKGLKEAARLHWEAGAESVLFHHNGPSHFASSAAFEEEARNISSWGWEAGRFSLFSAHQMSTCRMAGSSRLGVVRPSGESWEIKNLYLTDASALPRCSGVNPMLTIMALAHQTAQHMKAAASSMIL
ncbi:MAG TPA: GMC family oxidoreductase N-terminal domain-containing protein [Acidobacteriota bacterium]|nr:GMC family oxidoreductase N-terminal domain-containing protein [Acidobacteriota bacterium]